MGGPELYNARLWIGSAGHGGEFWLRRDSETHRIAISFQPPSLGTKAFSPLDLMAAALFILVASLLGHLHK